MGKMKNEPDSLTNRDKYDTMVCNLIKVIIFISGGDVYAAQR